MNPSASAFGSTNTAGSIFGKPASSNDSKSVFGGGAPTSGGFGSFGQNTSASGNTSSGGGLGFGFGSKADENKSPTTSAFGALTTPNKPSVFGNAGQTQSISLFGNPGGGSNPTSQETTPITTQAPSLFGNLGSTTPAGPPPAKAPLSFGFGQTAKVGGSLFGKPAQNADTDAQPAAATASPFGSTAQSPSTSPNKTSFFPSTTPASKPTTSLFGAQPNATATTSLFGKPASDVEKATDASTGSKSNPFGAPPPQDEGSAATSASAATSNDASKPDENAPKPVFGFPALSKPADKPATTTSTPSLFANFGGATSAANTSAATTDKPAGASKTPSLFEQFGKKNDTQASTTPTPSLFGNLGGENKDGATSSAPSASLFASVGQKRDAAESPTTSRAPAATTAPGSSTAPTSSTLFGAASKPAESGSTAQANGAASTTTGAAALGLSTAGPSPTPQSRLKNKSMDEIITRWASDLNKYQKEFQSQAEKVAEWDRAILENGNAISKLYSKTFQAERDIGEIEKQLTSVEGNQEELSQWLDRYERDVDEMMARQVGQGEGLQGPDQERERT